MDGRGVGTNAPPDLFFFTAADRRPKAINSLSTRSQLPGRGPGIPAKKISTGSSMMWGIITVLGTTVIGEKCIFDFSFKSFLRYLPGTNKQIEG